MRGKLNMHLQIDNENDIKELVNVDVYFDSSNDSAFEEIKDSLKATVGNLISNKDLGGGDLR